MKAGRRVQPSKTLKRTPSAELETPSPEDLLEEKRSVNKLSEDMELDFKQMEKGQRDALVTELHRMCVFKQFLDWYAATKREDVGRDVSRFRKYRLWLADVDEKLSEGMKAMHEAVDIANSNPRGNSQDELETLIVRKTLTALARSLNELQKAIDVVKNMQHSLAAGIHPTERTSVEEKLVPQEPKGLEHTKLPLSEKTKQIDLWFIGHADSILDKYRTKDGKPIPRHDKIIEHIFKFALNDRMRTDESIRKALSPVRRKPRQLF